MRCVFLLLALVTRVCVGQQHYMFSTANEPYNDLQNAVQIAPAHFGSGDMTFLQLDGETFNFFGVDFPFGGVKTFVVQTNGNIRIDNDSAMVIVDGAFTWLDSIDATSSLSYTVEGTNGNKIVKAQWKNLEVRNGVDGNFMNMQIWVHQGSGVIELRYGARSENNASGFTVSNGPNVGMIFAKDDFSQTFEKLWLNGSPENIVLDSNANLQFKALSGLPPEGTVFRFTPNVSTALVSAPVDVDLILFPNPSTGILTVSANDVIKELTLFDATGRKVLFSKGKQDFNMTTLPAGLYKAVVLTEKGSFSRTVIKQ